MDCGRYAPSPTGALHEGNLRTALLAWLQARLAGARFLMRMEDLDLPRSRPGSAEQILSDLRWLGIDWDAGPDLPSEEGPFEQSVRTSFYEAALQELTELGLVYPCSCSRKDIQAAASAPHGPAGPVYPGTCRDRPAEDAPDDVAWRFRVDPETMGFDDQIMGHFSQDLAAEVGDFVVRRRDGLFAYQLAVVVDDALMGVTDVLRGADLLDSTPRQIALFRALGYPVPRFWHVPLVLDGGGRRLAKRDQSDLVAGPRATGERPEQLVGRMAAELGLAGPGEEISAAGLLESLTLERFVLALKERVQPIGSGEL